MARSGTSTAGRKCVTDAAGAQRLSNKWVVLAMMLAIALVNYGDRYLLAGLAEPIKREFAVSDTFMGLLMGPAFALLYSLIAVPIALYADKASRIMIVCIGCVAWSGFTILSGLAKSPEMLAFARVGVGVGEAAFQAPAYALLAAYFPAEQRGKAFAVMGMSIYFGQLIGYAGGPAIAARGTWHDAFEVLGLVGIGIALMAWLTVREPPLVAAPASQPREPLWPLFKRGGPQLPLHDAGHGAGHAFGHQFRDVGTGPVRARLWPDHPASLERVRAGVRHAGPCGHAAVRVPG